MPAREGRGLELKQGRSYTPNPPRGNGHFILKTQNHASPTQIIDCLDAQYFFYLRHVSGSIGHIIAQVGFQERHLFRKADDSAF